MFKFTTKIFNKGIGGSPRYKGFTLAEVLITLGIIGIVAAMTIPTLMNNSAKAQYVTALKKSYSTLQQGFKMYLAREESESLGNTDLFDGVTAFDVQARRQKVDSIIKKYFNVAKSCVYNDASCDIKGVNLKTPSATAVAFQNDSWYIFKTPDGASIAMALGTTCQPNPAIIGNMKAFCGTIVIDVNGDKKPNVMGRDIFSGFSLGHDGVLHPANGVEFSKYWAGANWASSASYWRNDTTMCGTVGSSVLPATTYGYCPARVMEEGWTMNY